jgi:hypothetical protein
MDRACRKAEVRKMNANGTHPRSAAVAAAILASILMVSVALIATPRPTPAAPTAVFAEADDPARAGARAWLDALEPAYESGDTDAFIALLTPNYRFDSPDEDILRRFPDGFTAEDERDSHARLFAGGTNSEGRLLPRALAVDVEFLDAQVCPDPEHPGDAGHAVIHVRRACLAIRFADGSAMRDAAPHAFWVVQTPDGWRCRRWVERPVSAIDEALLAAAMRPDHDG